MCIDFQMLNTVSWKCKKVVEKISARKIIRSCDAWQVDTAKELADAKDYNTYTNDIMNGCLG